MGKDWIWSFKPELNRQHLYAIGIPRENGDITPIRSYSTIEELKESFIQICQLSNTIDIAKPIPIEKNKYEDWNGKEYSKISDLIEKVSEES